MENVLTRRDFKSMSNEEVIVIAKRGNKDAYNYLFETNKNFAHHIAKKFSNKWHLISYDDMVCMGYLGMIKAYNTYDINKDNKFITYASVCMSNEILMALRKINRKDILDISIETVLSSDSEGGQLRLEDVVADENSEEQLNQFIFNDSYKRIIEEFMKKATVFEKKVVQMILAHRNSSQNEIGRILGVSQSYISRVFKRIQEKIKKIAVKIDVIDNMEGEDKTMAKANDQNNLTKLAYMLQTYQNLKVKDYCEILKISYPTYQKMLKSLNQNSVQIPAKWDEIDQEVEQYYKRVYPKKLSSPVKTTKLEISKKIEERTEKHHVTGKAEEMHKIAPEVSNPDQDIKFKILTTVKSTDVTPNISSPPKELKYDYLNFEILNISGDDLRDYLMKILNDIPADRKCSFALNIKID